MTMLPLLAFLILAENNLSYTPTPDSPNPNPQTEEKVQSSGTRGCPFALPQVTLTLPTMELESTSSESQYPIRVSVIDLETNHQIFSWETRTSEQVQQIPLPSSLEGEKQALVVGIPCPNDPYAGQFLETFINR